VGHLVLALVWQALNETIMCLVPKVDEAEDGGGNGGDVVRHNVDEKGCSGAGEALKEAVEVERPPLTVLLLLSLSVVHVINFNICH
jgi:hypothetical protein